MLFYEIYLLLPISTLFLSVSSNKLSGDKSLPVQGRQTVLNNFLSLGTARIRNDISLLQTQNGLLQIQIDTNSILQNEKNGQQDVLINAIKDATAAAQAAADAAQAAADANKLTCK